MKAAIQLDNDVQQVLARAAIEGNILRLPAQLERKLYERVDQALDALGGRWNRKVRGHVFGGDPRAAIEAATSTGAVAHPNPHDFFATGPELAERCADELGATRRDRILEPSAGEAALVMPVVRRLGGVPGPANMTLVELDERRCAVLHERGFAAHLEPGDFLALKPSSVLRSGRTMGLFDRIVMNPPFANEGDARHIGHALDFLAPGGRLVAIASAGFRYRSTRKLTKAVRERVLAWGGTIEDLPEDAFKHAGVTVRTVLVVVDRPKEAS